MRRFRNIFSLLDEIFSTKNTWSKWKSSANLWRELWAARKAQRR